MSQDVSPVTKYLMLREAGYNDWPEPWDNYAKCVLFIRMVAENFCFNQSDEEGLKKLVEFEEKASKLLERIGESK